MGTVYLRGSKLWVGYMLDGKQKCRSTPFVVGQEDQARALVEAIERQIAAGQDEGGGVPTVRSYARQFVQRRRDRKLSRVDKDETRLSTYVFPVLGDMRMTDVRPRHVAELVRSLKARVGVGDEQLAPRTVRNIYGLLHTMFVEAIVDEVIASNPCVVRRGDLPAKVDKDPSWRAGAIFTREEVETLISSDALELDRRVLYGLLFLTGCRFGESAALTWADYDAEAKPLGRLLVTKSYDTYEGVVKSTKTGVSREVPVHPTLASILAEWKLGGLPLLLGRPARSEDLIIPSRAGKHRLVTTNYTQAQADFAGLGWRRRRQHDTRRTFISLARADGASKDLLEVITHGPRGDIVSMYSTFPWATLCAEVAKLNISKKGEAQVLRLAVGETTTSLLQRPQGPVNAQEINAKRGTRKRGYDVEAEQGKSKSAEVSRDALPPPVTTDEANQSDCSNVVNALRRARAAFDSGEVSAADVRALLDRLIAQLGGAR